MLEHPWRDYVRIYDNLVIRETAPNQTPIHAVGAALLLHNNSMTTNAVFSIADSPDGITYTVVTFSTFNQTGLTAITIVPQGFNVILFRSLQAFVRFTLATAIPEGVYAYINQWRPVGLPTAY